METQEFAAAISSHGHAPATEAGIAEFEAAIGHALPADYRAFLSICGGGYMGLQPSFNWPNGDWAGRVHTVGGLRGDDSDYSLLSRWRAPQWKLPRGFIWILRDHGGNPVGLALSGVEAGQIFFLDHEMEPEEEWDSSIASGAELGYLLLLAPSFSAFVAGVYAD